MTHIKAIMTGTLSILFVVASIVTSALAGQQQKVTLRVDGLACPFCAYGMEKKLKRIENLEKLDIKINDGLVNLYFKEGTKIDKELIFKKVKEAGFTPKGIEIESRSKEVTKNLNAAKGQKITLNIKGMTCESCVARVINALSNVDCVSDVQVSLEKGQATLMCSDPGKDKAKLVEAVEHLGFKAEVAKQ